MIHTDLLMTLPIKMVAGLSKGGEEMKGGFFTYCFLFYTCSYNHILFMSLKFLRSDKVWLEAKEREAKNNFLNVTLEEYR